MTAYRYRAARNDGGIVRGVLDAPDAARAAAAVADLGLHPLALDVTPDAPRRRLANRRDLAIAFRGIATLVSAGVPLERAVGAIEPLARGALRESLAAARSGLREGKNLAGALGGGPHAVPGVVLGLLRAGERGGRLGAALEQVAAHLEQEAELMGRLRQALAYPLVLAVGGTISVLVIGMVIVPRFAELLAGMGQQLPLATRLLLTGSAALRRFWLPLVVAMIGGAGLIADRLRRPEVRRRWHALLLDLPFVGPVRLGLATTRVARALGGALGVGMPLLGALESAREAAGDDAVAERLGRVRERVSQGARLAASLERERALDATALQLIAVGETSGRLAPLCTQAGDLAAQTAERGLKTLVTLVEPALVVLFGGLVAFVAAALLQAVYSLRPT